MARDDDESEDTPMLTLEDRIRVGEAINERAEEALASGSRTDMREALEWISDVTAPGAILDVDGDEVEVLSVPGDDEDEEQEAA